MSRLLPSRSEDSSGADLDRLQEVLQIRFKDRTLLQQAFTHRSYAHEHNTRGIGDNERLEFLGDAVIELVAADLLYRRQPEVGEGTLTLDRAAMVSTGALAAAARRLGLGQYLRVGRGVENSGGRDLNSLLANTFEALMGAIYLDQGLAAAESAFKIMASIQPGGLVNYKGRLQELTQADGEGVPTYEVLEATGPGHRRQYRVEVQLAGKALAVGEGTTRRAAEQAAAREAIGVLEGTHPPAGSDRPEAQDMASGGTP